ncbi:MAG: iron-containing alcohol dehydrogenase [Ruminococcus sp.]|nr:iron-containing alcohol dehydrogenase [Ruminococcus sp.]
MRFFIPTKIYAERGAVINHSAELAALGKRAFIVTGKSSSRKNGSLSDVTDALFSQGREYLIFDNVEENPSVETVMTASMQAAEFGADFVIGIGGGSPMDAAKAIAVMAANMDKGESYLFENDPDAKVLPVAEVPTTCGTGSEATAVAVLTQHKKRTKGSMAHRVFPVLSLCDPGYLASAPKSVITATAIDAFGHLTESLINTASTDYSRIFAEQGLKLWAQSKAVLMGEREPEEGDYLKLLNASTVAGMAIAHTGTGIPHGLSYTLTYEAGIPHGIAVGYFLEGYIALAEEKDRRAVLDLSGFGLPEEFGAFFRQVCSVGGADRELLSLAAENLMHNPAKLRSCPYTVDEKIIEEICRRAEL